MPADDLLPASPALNGRLQWFARQGNAESLASAEFWRPDEQLYASASTLERAELGSSDTFTLTSGTMLLAGGLLLIPGIQINGAAAWSSATAAVAPTAQWVALIDARDLTVLAKSADKTNEAWAANSEKDFVFTGGFTPTGGSLIPAYIGIVVVAGTPPSLRAKTLAATSPNLKTPQLSGTGPAGLTDPASCPNPVTLATGNGFFYAHLT